METGILIGIIVVILLMVGIVFFSANKSAKIKSKEKPSNLPIKKQSAGGIKKKKRNKPNVPNLQSPESDIAKMQKEQRDVDVCKKNGHRWLISSYDCTKVCVVCNVKKENHEKTQSEYGEDGFVYQVCKKCGKKTYDSESSSSMGMWS